MIWQEVQAILGPEGPIARATPGFQLRNGQMAMAQAVCEAIESETALVVEAGTGTGKTFAYLLPALLSGRRILVSTATKALQDQLFERDLPRLLDILGLPMRAARLKGRSNYLCTHRMTLAQGSAVGLDAAAQNALRRVKEWSGVTLTGDLSEVEGLGSRSSVMPWITANRDNCLGSQCPDFKTCHLQTARKVAMAADLVVINHHLYFADLAVRESGMAELLPSVDVVIFDEAHALNETGVQFLGRHLGSLQILDWVRDTLAATLRFARGLAEWQTRMQAVETAVREFRLALGHGNLATGTSARLTVSGLHRLPLGVELEAWQRVQEGLHQALQAAVDELDTVTELHPELERLAQRGLELMSHMSHLQQPTDEEHVQWLEVGRHWRWTQAPLDAAAGFASVSRRDGKGPRSWIFTSATLGDEAQLKWFRDPLGLEQAKPLVVSSPFNWPEQSALWVPSDLPAPAQDDHLEALAQAVAPFIRKLHGRTLILTTTLRNLDRMAQWLRNHVEGWAAEDAGGKGAQPLQVLAQGQASKSSLLQQFAQAGQSGQPGAVLVASVSFWEGVDLPGDMLQLVVLDKLPFAPPGDPIQEAREKRMRSKGLTPFTALSLPQAAVWLKQGAGRLIRTESDQGMLIIGDVRLLRMAYGKRLLAALPPMTRLQTAEQALSWVDGFTTVSTKVIDS